MKKRPEIMIIGGDCRFSYMEKIFTSEGYKAKRIYPGSYKADDFTACDVFILPVPVSRDNINISTPLAGEPFCFSDFVRLLPEKCIVAGGMFTEEQREKLMGRNVTVFDYYSCDSLAIKNAVPTAEGVIGILINALPVTLASAECCVTGYGKCGSVIARKLKALGADVTCAARSDKDLAAAVTDGMKACRLSSLSDKSSNFDAIINTVPSLVIDEKVISALSKSCVIIETASAPFGVDFDTAAAQGINTIRAGSLPGRTSPLTAGKIICDTVLSFYWSDNYGN